MLYRLTIYADILREFFFWGGGGSVVVLSHRLTFKGINW